MRRLLCASLLGAGCLTQVAQLAPVPDSGPELDGGPMLCNGGVTPQEVNFGGVLVHSQATQIVTLTNCGNLDVGVTPSAIFGPQAALFTIDSPAGAPFTVRANESMSMGVTYAPDAPSTLDTAWFALTVSQGTPVLIDVQGQGLQGGLKIFPVPLNFAFIQRGHSVTLTLHLMSVGNETISVPPPSIVNDDMPPAFSIASGSWGGGDLAPGQTADVNITFTPNSGSGCTGELVLGALFDGVPLNGSCGGPAISCTPRMLGFGVTSTGFPSALPLVCTNTGTDVPDHPEAGLVLSGLMTDSPYFSAQVDPQSMFPASEAQPLAATQWVLIDVVYAPTQAENDTGTLTIHSNATDGTSLPPPTVELSGEGFSR